MDRFIRRALCTALVAGGLAVVGASAAHAAEAAPAETAATGAVDAAAVPGARADRTGLLDGLTADDGVLGALARADVAGVVTGVLGEGDTVDDLLPDAPEPGPGVPETAEPGAEDPAADEPGTEPAPAEPDAEPAPEEPGAEEPGTQEPGAEEPGADEPGTGPGVDLPGIDLPDTEVPGIDLPGTEIPGTEEPGAEEPATEEPATEEPAAEEPATDGPGTGIIDLPDLDGPARPGHGGHQDPDGRPSTDRPDSGGAVHGPRPGATADRPETVPGVELTSASRHDLTSPSAPSSTGPVRRTADVPAVQVPVADERPAADQPDSSVDLRWGDGESLPDRPMHGEGSLSGDLSRSFLGSTDLPSPRSTPDEEEPVPAPGEKPLLMGHMFTGQLSLISVLLGLGIAALRTRRR
ncbi:hypothetical protein ACFQBY_10925 [Promicromonospora citrea]|uniref:Uncharacterized protein n=1 Tax=Promicromonospora citrea TaxID=43677 RepID=A0A8H9GKT8_9MICO|nr:hypothetical protein [Promicromonospora citrea]NNH50824.1 hypothetical protein [Promicromonospora citrea]GGM35709.1 hypothetical protein GCM10010102_33830 [Promicromonospora citrea]